MTIERVWKRAMRKRHDERQRTHDEQLSRANTAHVCAVPFTAGTPDGTVQLLCGNPLDDDGLCEVHQ